MEGRVYASKRRIIVNFGDYSLEILRERGRTYLASYGRRIPVDETPEELVDRVLEDQDFRRDLLERLRNDGEPYGAHVFLQFDSPLPLAVRALRTRGLTPEGILKLVRGWDELSRAIQIIRAGWGDEVAKEVEEWAQGVREAMSILSEVPLSLEERGKVIKRLVQNPLSSVVPYLVKDALGMGKSFVYGKEKTEWKLNRRGFVMWGYEKGNRLLLVVSHPEYGAFRFEPGEKGSVMVYPGGRRTLDLSPEEIALWIHIFGPDDLVRGVREEEILEEGWWKIGVFKDFLVKLIRRLRIKGPRYGSLQGKTYE